MDWHDFASGMSRERCGRVGRGASGFTSLRNSIGHDHSWYNYKRAEEEREERLGINKESSSIYSGMPTPPFATIATDHSRNWIFNKCNGTLVW